MDASRFLTAWQVLTRRLSASRATLLAVIGTVAAPGLTAVAVAAAQATPTTVIIVGVSDAETGEALVGTQVLLPVLSRVTQTDGLGEARFVGIPSGLHRIRIRRLGHAAVDTSLTFVGDTTGVVFRLYRTPVAIGAMEVKAASSSRLHDFEMRRTIGTGRYLTAADLEKDANRPFGVVAMTKFPGLQLVTDGSGRPHIASVRGSCGVGMSPSEAILARARGGGSGGRGPSTDGPTGMTGGSSGTSTGTDAAPAPGMSRTSMGSCMPSKQCYVLTFLDDIQLDSADFDLVTTWDIAGVEYYTGNSVPARYRVSGAACGVMLVWSK
jgi:hypothetical protein